jgi:hypothetical protein
MDLVLKKIPRELILSPLVFIENFERDKQLKKSTKKNNFTINNKHIYNKFYCKIDHIKLFQLQ